MFLERELSLGMFLGITEHKKMSPLVHGSRWIASTEGDMIIAFIKNRTMWIKNFLTIKKVQAYPLINIPAVCLGSNSERSIAHNAHLVIFYTFTSWKNFSATSLLVDHMNGDKCDACWLNLRALTQKENFENSVR